MVAGLLLLVIVRQHDRLTRSAGRRVDYDVSMAVSAAIMLQGVFSAFYHVCPTSLNFQFGHHSRRKIDNWSDTTFMYILAILGGVELHSLKDGRGPPPATIFALISLAVVESMIGVVTVLLIAQTNLQYYHGRWFWSLVYPLNVCIGGLVASKATETSVVDSLKAVYAAARRRDAHLVDLTDEQARQVDLLADDRPVEL